jgi:hypothetical protein
MLIVFNTGTAWIRSPIYLADIRSEAFTADEVDKIFSGYQQCTWLMIITSLQIKNHHDLMKLDPNDGNRDIPYNVSNLSN